MKLINYLILRITLFFTVVLLLWSGVYFILQMKEIHDGNDEGLTNLKQEFVLKANKIPHFVENMERNAPLNLIVKEISRKEAETIIENFNTTKIYFPTELEKEEVRMLTSAFHCTMNDKYYQIQFFTSTVESDDLLKNLLYLLLGLWIVLITTIFFVSRAILSQANKPFFSLLKNLKDFRLDSSKMIDFPETRIEEYVQLNEAVKELLDKNISVFTEQKQFIENISHELQTPLAIAVSKLEMLLEKHQTDKEQANEISVVLITLNRMKRLNINLLLLSKIRNRQFPAVSQVDLRKVLETVLADFEEIAEYKEITIETAGDTSLSLQMNEDLAQILFTNLVKNAITHNINGGKILLAYAENAITISNSGNAAITDIFNRYKSEKSSGIGLSIVKSIANLYGIKISYRFENDLHIFELKLK
ncbi:MAG: HAMP domain-containing histidine kinase [Tannerellaceae bacterium]|jgi:signal transduction histidine kinase|nr:HAMP domain-containing histidine kinase [Tannerellaceae bacterium]